MVIKEDKTAKAMLCKFLDYLLVMSIYITILYLLTCLLTGKNFKNQVAELLQRPRAQIKILHFGGDHHFPQKSPTIKSLFDQDKRLFQLLAANTCFGWQFQQSYQQGKPPGHLDRV